MHSLRTTMRHGLRLLQDGLTDQVFLRCLRLGGAARERTLAFLASLWHLNGKRTQIQYEPTDVSSDGVMVNVTAVLLRLCAPFMGDGSKVRSIHIGDSSNPVIHALTIALSVSR